MKIWYIVVMLFGTVLFSACSSEELDEKGFRVSTGADVPEQGLSNDSLRFETRPSSVLLTGIPNIRLATVYKVNVNTKKGTRFIGDNNSHRRYSALDGVEGNQWNSNYMPGFEAVYGYNMVNVSHYDIGANKRRDLFDDPVLIRTLYYPSFSKDTLYHVPLQRDYFMVSMYDEDTNKDGYINMRDLRRFHWFDRNGEQQALLVPGNYSVVSSEYDPGNDFMYVFARLDENGNGNREEAEPTHIFWVDLKDPSRNGRLY